jgi:hypothetical protein
LYSLPDRVEREPTMAPDSVVKALVVGFHDQACILGLLAHAWDVVCHRGILQEESEKDSGGVYTDRHILHLIPRVRPRAGAETGSLRRYPRYSSSPVSATDMVVKISKQVRKRMLTGVSGHVVDRSLQVKCARRFVDLLRCRPLAICLVKQGELRKEGMTWSTTGAKTSQAESK